MSLVFDHSKETLSSSMNMSDNQIEELSEKLTILTKNFMFTAEEKKSELAEKIAIELSYSELVFIATHKVLDACAQTIEKQKKMLLQLEGFSELLDKLKEKFGDVEDED